MRLACLEPAMASGMAPPAISLIVGSTLCMALAKSLCLISNCSTEVWPNCQSPHGSLPTPQSFTSYGCGWPLAARCRPIGVVAAPLAYSTYCAADQASPKPAFSVTYGSTSSSRHMVINSSVPTSFGCTAFQRVHDWRALVRIADGVAPFVGRHEVTARKTIDARMKLLERGDDLGAKPLHVIGGHQRYGADVKSARARSRDLQPCGAAVRRRRAFPREFHVLGPELRDGDGLAVGRVGSPDQADRDPRARVTREHDASRVRLAFAHRQARLPDSVGSAPFSLASGVCWPA